MLCCFILRPESAPVLPCLCRYAKRNPVLTRPEDQLVEAAMRGDFAAVQDLIEGQNIPINAQNTVRYGRFHLETQRSLRTEWQVHSHDFGLSLARGNVTCHLCFCFVVRACMSIKSSQRHTSYALARDRRTW